MRRVPRKRGYFLAHVKKKLYLCSRKGFENSNNISPLEGTGINVNNGNLAVYGQIKHEGFIYIYAENCINASGNITISNLRAYSYSTLSSITSGGDVIIVNGNFEATGINANTITLGYLTNDFKVYSSKYNGTVKIRDGQTLCNYYDNNITYTDTLTSEQVNEIQEGYLAPYYSTVTHDVEGYGEGDGKWVFIASPIVGSSRPDDVWYLFSEDISLGQYDYDLYRLNPSNTMWENYHKHDSNLHPFVLENGKGYLYAKKENVTLEFHGAYNMDNSKVVALEKGYNLVGNPFPVAATLNRSYYVMNADGTGIVAEAVDESTAIAPCIGVIVQATGDNETVTFNRYEQQASAPDNGNLSIVLTQANSRDNALLDKAIVSFNEGAELGKFYFLEQDANIYIPQGDEEYAIAYSNGQSEMPLNFKARKNGSYILNFSGNVIARSAATKQSIHLIDNLTGTDVDLLVTPNYSFTARHDDYASRFKLVFGNENENQNENEDFAFISDGNLIITGTGTLQVIDMLGHVLVNHEVNSAFRIPHSAFSTGVYVLRLVNGENVKTQKIIVK